MTLKHHCLLLRNRCADDITFNGFPVAAANKVLSTGAQTFWNIQNGGEHACCAARNGSCSTQIALR